MAGLLQSRDDLAAVHAASTRSLHARSSPVAATVPTTASAPASAYRPAPAPYTSAYASPPRASRAEAASCSTVQPALTRAAESSSHAVPRLAVMLEAHEEPPSAAVGAGRAVTASPSGAQPSPHSASCHRAHTAVSQSVAAPAAWPLQQQQQQHASSSLHARADASTDPPSSPSDAQAPAEQV
ncbi:MAG: hypothetical protein EOO41_04580, partial [Methanobacteriota archaeon]